MKIFISYRREDSAGYAGRLFDRLANRFDNSNIFMDIDTIELGVDFVQKIEDAVSSCDVLLAVIGPNWLTVTNADAQPRLEDANDFVRLEILSALQRDIHVIPVLVHGASMPNANDLPSALDKLSRRNGIKVDHVSFNSDIDRLIDGLENILGLSSEPKQSSKEQLDVSHTTVPDEGDEFPQSSPELLKFLPGFWQVQINTPTLYGMVPTQFNFEFRSNGTFQGRSPMLAVEGQWNISNFQQLVLMGTQSDGFQVAPYQVMVQFTEISKKKLSGTTSGGETTFWNRAG